MATIQRIFALFAFAAALPPFASLSAQIAPSGHYWIFFNQRASNHYTPQALGISERALERRAKVLRHDEFIDQYDIPVPEYYLQQLRAQGVTVLSVSRWLNAAAVEADSQRVHTISLLPFVANVAPMRILTQPRLQPSSPIIPEKLQKSTHLSRLDYGPSYTQLATEHITDVHSLGINGTGVIIGMIDDGFDNHRTHVALKNIRVLAEYDFIHNISDTQLQPWESTDQGIHGAGTLSSVAGFDSGNIVGGAFGVSVVLAKTEMDSSESGGNTGDFGSEEYTYVAGLEWMERLGVDIASSSLAYKDFNPPDTSYSYSSLNGHTTVVAKAASIAASKGVLLCTAMGNEGHMIIDGTGSFVHESGTLWSPADADSILGVGAISSDGVLTGFSSTGPTSDGRIKPEVVAQGTSIYWAYGGSTNGYWSVQGTSCSTPIVASAAALVLSAHPDWTPMQVRQALMQTAVQINDGTSQTSIYPNNYYGYGLIDAYAAVLSDGLAFSNIPIITATDSTYIVTTWIASKTSLFPGSLALNYRDSTQTTFTRVQLVAGANPNEYWAIIQKPFVGVIPIGYFSAADAAGLRTSPFDAPNHLFSIQPTPDSLRQFYPPVEREGPPAFIPTNYVLMNNYPNPFNSTTVITFYAPTTHGVELIVFNLLGQRVKTLFRGTPVPNWNSIRWNDANDDYGHPISSGVYFARLKTARSVLTIKMLYVK